MRLCTLLVLGTCIAASLAQTLMEETCDTERRMAEVGVNEADALIGGLFEMRINGDDGYGCGSPHLEMMLAYESARWALTKINDDNYIPGIKLGMKAYDDCYSDIKATENVNHFYPQYSTASMYCNDTGKINLGVLALTSWTAKAAARRLNDFDASIITPVGASPILSDKTLYPYSFRTTPSATEQIEAMTALMRDLGWGRVLLVYSDSDYGRDSMHEFVRQSRIRNVCVVDTIPLPRPDSTEYRAKLENIGKYDVQGAIYFGDDFSMKLVMSTVDGIYRDTGTAGDIQWMISYTNLKLQPLSNRIRGVVFVHPGFVTVDEFYDYFTSSLDENNPPTENPWYKEWFMETFQCVLPGVDYEPYSRYSQCTPKSQAQKMDAVNLDYAYADYTIRAVYAYARALKDAHSAMCGSPGVCLALQRMSPKAFSEYLGDVNFDMAETGIPSMNGIRVEFDANGDVVDSSYDFWNYNNQPSGPYSFKQVGRYVNDMLSLDLEDLYMYNADRNAVLPTLPSSMCPASGCANCIVPRPMVSYNFMPGDIVVGGLFDLHAQGSEILTCGNLKANHAMAAVAFKYGLETVKDVFPNILQGINLGSLIVDLCDNAETGRLFLNNVLGGRHIVSSPDGIVDPHKIQGIVGELDSTEAMSMALMLGQFQMPYIESSATSIYLSAEDLFPTFTRSVPSDDKQMHAIILLLKRYGWTHVQVIYSADNYGRSGYELLKRFGARNSICIAASHEVDSAMDIPSVVQNLQKKPEARAVITVVDYDQVRDMLLEIQANNLQGQFLLIGTEAWGRSTSIISGLEAVAEGSITLDLVHNSLAGFRSWVDTLDASDLAIKKEMPFFTEWYQHAFSCYLDATNRGIYEQECQTSTTISFGQNYAESAYTAFTINSAYAIARAFHETLNDICGDGYDGVCPQFRSGKDVKEKILEYLQDSEYTLSGEMFKMEDGEGQANYDMFVVQNGNYVKIGTYKTSDGEVDLDFLNPVAAPSNFESQCSGFCSECVYMLQAQPFNLIPGKELKIGVNIAIHQSGSNDPFLCGDIRLINGVQSALAVAYALDRVNNGNAPVGLNDVQLGALIFDHCNSPARTSGLPSALYSGILEAPDAAEVQPNLNTIRAWITDDRLVTEQMKDFFSDFHLPVISPMSTSNTFLSDEDYPTFVRTVQGDSTIASAIATLAKSLALQYVSVVYSDNIYGHSGVETFSNTALQEGICVTHKMAFSIDKADSIIQSLVDLPTHVVVIYLIQEDVREFLRARGENSLGSNLVIISPEPFPLIYKQLGNAAVNVMSLQMKTGGLSDYTDHLNNIDAEDLLQHANLKEYYMELYQCNLPGEYKFIQQCDPNIKIPQSSQFFADNYVLPFINSVYTFVGAAHETLKILCGEDYRGVCQEFYSNPNTNSILIQKIREVSFTDESGATFQFIGKEGNSGREIALFDGTKMVPVADFAGASINFMDSQFSRTFEDTKSNCQLPCTECINNRMNFTFIPGDVLVGGIFDVHEADLVPFSCGEINTLRGFQLLEAFHFAIDQVNDKTGPFANILKDVRLGGIGLDSCQSPARGGYLVSNIHNGLSQLERNGQMIDPDDIEAYIGTYSSDRSIYLARLLKSLKIPQVSYAATSVQLLDQDRYPYFIRTVPADDRQAMAMLKFLLRYNIRYVQVVHTADNYGEQAAAIFNKFAVEEKICVAQTVSYPYNGDLTVESANDIVLSLLEKPIANTVVIFASSRHINLLLQAIRRNPEAPGKFRFIGSDSWANTKESTNGVEDLALGSVTLDLDVTDLREFDDYLATKTPANYPENPWFPSYYEKIHNCYLTIPDGRYPERCQASPQNIVASKRYKQDTAIVHVINAVFASAIGIDRALKRICGEDYTTVCEPYRNLENRRDIVLNETKYAKFMDMSDQLFSFSDRGDGNKGYVLYSIDTSTVLGYVYNPIGKYSSDGILSMTNNAYKPSWDGSCERVDSCTECPTIRNRGTRFMLTPGINNNPTPGTAVIVLPIHSAGNDIYQCGTLSVATLIRALAFRFGIESSTVTGRPFDLRTLILDNCDNQLRIDQDLFNLFTTGKMCNTEFDSGDTMIDASSVIGVMTSSSRYVVAANRVTAPFKIQLWSSSASSTAFNERWRYPYFARTVPPDDHQMAVIASILERNGWSYISVLYTMDSYGVNGFRQLRDIVNEGQFSCIGFAEALRSQATVDELRPVVRRLTEVQGIGVIVLIAAYPRVVLEAIVAEGVADRYILIGSDSWGSDSSVTAGLANRFAGSITLTFRDAFYRDFINEMTTLNLNNRKGIPDAWFEEFYQHIHQCILPSSSISVPYGRICAQTEVITKEKVEAQGIGLRDIAAAYAVKTGLNKFYRTHACAGLSFAQCVALVDDARDVLFDYTLETTWNVPQIQVNYEQEFNMDIGDKRYWNIGYNVFYLMRNNSLTKVGSQMGGNFAFDLDAYYDGLASLQRPAVVSRCPEDQFCDCNYPENTQSQQIAKKYMGDHEPRNYFVYDEDTGKQVYDWPIWAIAVAVLSGIGLFVGLMLFFYFLIFYPVRGGTTILGFMMMVGIFGVYGVNFAFFLPASEAVCGGRRFAQGVVYSIVFAALLVKAIDNWRFKDSEYSTESYRGLTNPLALVVIAIGIVLVQCIIPIEWLILEPPSASLMDDSTNQHDWMWCDPHDFYDISLVMSMIFVIFLVALTAIFAALAWDSESNYYESRWIFVSCVCTVGCFLVWMVVSTNAGPPFRDPAIAIANFVNGTALLICIPIRKLFLLIQVSSDEKDGIILEDPGHDLYSTVYNNQAYQSDVFQPDMKENLEVGY